MKINRNYPILILFLFSALLYSCQSELLEVEGADVHTTNALGKKLENPYSLKNMREAQSVLNARSGLPEGRSTIEATHLYVRFLPKDKTEYIILKEKLGLELFSYPLDREVTGTLTDYHDPSVATENITWQYTRVPADFSFPDMEYEVLDELYMPWIEDETTTARSGPADKRVHWQELIDTSLSLTGNLPEKKTVKARNGDFNVAVPVFVNAWDDELQGYVPVKGVKVRLTGFTEWGTAYTDGSGFALFNGKAISTAHRIDISWEDAQNWYIFSNDSSTVASTTGPYVNYSGMYYINIGKGNASLFYATLHRAVYNFYNNSFGIRYPSLPYYYLSHGYFPEEGEDNSWMQRRFHVCASSGNGYATVPLRKTVPHPDSIYARHILVNRYQDSIIAGNKFEEHSTTDWFAMTTHETAHFAHICHYNINRADQGVMESWARAVEATLTNEEIRGLTGNNSFKHEEDYQYIDLSGYRNFFILGYTPVFIDCMDDYNQNMFDRSKPVDRVSGYTLQQIESCLDGSHSIYDIKTKLKEKYNNPTSQYLDELFSYYDGIDFYIY